MEGIKIRSEIRRLDSSHSFRSILHPHPSLQPIHHITSWCACADDEWRSGVGLDAGWIFRDTQHCQFLGVGNFETHPEFDASSLVKARHSISHQGTMALSDQKAEHDPFYHAPSKFALNWARALFSFSSHAMQLLGTLPAMFWNLYNLHLPMRHSQVVKRDVSVISPTCSNSHRFISSQSFNLTLPQPQTTWFESDRRYCQNKGMMGAK